ncbi:MAG: hypothetical protein E7328_02455 [Clostridiales bacterium]|nr:hypothetical protein [Clostridiales bacterium]
MQKNSRTCLNICALLLILCILVTGCATPTPYAKLYQHISENGELSTLNIGFLLMIVTGVTLEQDIDTNLTESFFAAIDKDDQGTILLNHKTSSANILITLMEEGEDSSITYLSEEGTITVQYNPYDELKIIDASEDYNGSTLGTKAFLLYLRHALENFDSLLKQITLDGYTCQDFGLPNAADVEKMDLKFAE